MKLVKTVVLLFSEGRSDKVYEVDLCEVGTNQFVVNFRYGKRGAALKDGSKTVAPVSRVEADKVFDKLVQTKVEQGYLHEGAARPPSPAAPAAAGRPPTSPFRDGAAPAGGDPRVRIILERLGAAGADRRWFRREGSNRTWALERAIWRAGELKLREAEPLLLHLLGTAVAGATVEAGGKGIRDYSVAWALGFCGSAMSMESLGRLYSDTKAPEHVRRIATEALLRLSDPATRAEFKFDSIERLPESLRGPARGTSAEAFTAALEAHLASEDPHAFAAMDFVYLVDNEVVRPGFLAVLKKAPLTSPFFYWIRHIFKAAEYRRDAEVFGLLAYRFEHEKANERTWSGSTPRARVNPFTGQTIAMRTTSPPPRQVYASATREYLRRRIWRTLRRLGELGDPAFVPMAVGVLLPFDDASDPVPARAMAGYAARRNVHWDTYAPYRAFNHILYTNSPRYELRRNTRAWRTKGNYAPGAPPPDVREEAFAAVWERTPAGLMHLLAESTCAPVHVFAARAMRACPTFMDQLDIDDIAMILSRPYEPTARLGFDLAKKRYDPSKVNAALLLAVASCVYAPAREQGLRWIDEQRTQLIGDTAFLAALVTAAHEDARMFARRLLRSSVLPAATGQALIGRIVATLLTLQGEAAGKIALDATQTITSALGSFLGSVSPQVIRDLLAHPLAGVQELGAELLLKHDSRSGLIPADVILLILHSEFEAVRAVGMRLLAELPDDGLTLNYKLLVQLTCDRNPDLRNAARPLVKRVASAHADIGQAIAEALVDSLLRRKLAEDVPSHVLRILKEDIRASLSHLDRETVWRLLQSGSPHAQELGGLLLAELNANDLELDQIAKLASHEILSVRQASWAMYARSLPRIQASMKEAVRILDAKWKDSRDWGFAFFRALPPEIFTADVLVTVIDSVRDDVQAFGRELVQKCFQEEQGPDLLLKLSEHPSRNVQLFASNYLERYATGKPEKLEALVPYFTSVLSRINQGRVAKARVLSFLLREGEKNEDAARTVTALVHRLSATIAIEDRGTAIATMVAIHRAQPGVPLPLRFKEPQLRTAPQAPRRQVQ